MILHVATSNAGKLAEFATAAQPAGVLIAPLPGLAAMPEPVEDAVTFLGNAELKAVAYSRRAAPGTLVLADDSGIAVDALDGAPGVRSARFAGDAHYLPGASLTPDERNNRLLLDRMRATPAGPRRSCRFVCALAVARDGETVLRAEGICEGELLLAPRGTAGFGYDPLFLLPALGKTMAELSREDKWQVSHRGQAFRALLEALQRSDL